MGYTKTMITQDPRTNKELTEISPLWAELQRIKS